LPEIRVSLQGPSIHDGELVLEGRSMDALSEALNSVRMTGALFFDAICTKPWGFVVPPIQQVAHVLSPGTERLVGYHLVTEGTALVRLQGAPDIAITAGDIVIIPHGDPHTVTNGAPSSLIDSEASLTTVLAGNFSTWQIGGGGEATRFVCGYFGCERHADRLFLAGLPPMIKINILGDSAGAWLDSSIRHLLAEAGSTRPGRKVLLSKMAEALFIETLRRYMEQLPPEQTGWLAGARDPIVGAALALLHQRPSRPWTLPELAAEAGTSRTVLSERFSHFLDEPPLTYLARWRLQLAARRLQMTHDNIVQIALDVGYESEAAFNRAFKREFGFPPAQYRRKLADNARPTARNKG
jgi:AraC-like DNA-binding protein